MVLKKLAKDMFTEIDNETFDISKFLGFVTVLVAVFLAGWDVVVNQVQFSMQDFGIGIGVLFAGLAAVLGFKKDSTDDKKL